MCMKDANNANCVLVNFVQCQVRTDDEVPHTGTNIFTRRAESRMSGQQLALGVYGIKNGIRRLRVVHGNMPPNVDQILPRTLKAYDG